MEPTESGSIGATEAAMAPTAPPGEQRPTPGIATAALVLGILALLTMCFGIGVPLGLVALVLGIVAMNRVSREQSRGQGFAIAGIAMGGAAMLLGLVATMLMIGIMLPALGAARRTAMQTQNNTQLRGIHQNLVSFAQGNNEYMPGLDATGALVDGTVEGRFRALLDGNYVTAEYLISPGDDGMVPWAGGALTPQNYSYAMLEIAEDGGRRAEWASTLNSEAVVLSDRNVGPAGQPQSIWTDAPGEWRGGVAWNDNYVGLETTSVMPFTQYGEATGNSSDDLFEAQGPDDALLIHTGATR